MVKNNPKRTNMTAKSTRKITNDPVPSLKFHLDQVKNNRKYFNKLSYQNSTNIYISTSFGSWRNRELVLVMIHFNKVFQTLKFKVFNSSLGHFQTRKILIRLNSSHLSSNVFIITSENYYGADAVIEQKVCERACQRAWLADKK